MSFESQLYEADEEFQAPWVPSISKTYEVFLSFRGLDTRKNFTDHLYKTLTQGGYRIFRDEDEIEPGENIKSELREAIGNSKMSVVVFSKDYANSAACLFELQTILELRKTSGHVILPVFYKVDPSQIKEQAEKLDFKNRTTEQVKAWSAALKEVAGMKGMVSENQSNGYEVPLIKAIVDFVEKKVGSDLDLSFRRIRNLIRVFGSLEAQKEDMQAKLESQMLQMWKRPKKEVVVWFGDVASLKAEVQRLEQEVFGESRVYSRVQLGKNIDEKIRLVAELQERGRAFNDDLLVPIPLRLWTNVESTEARKAEIIRECLRETLSVR